MLRLIRLTFALALLGAFVFSSAALASGGGGGGGGGGGTGGGGGGTGGGGTGGGGGGGTAVKYGAISRVSSAATCDAGTSISVTLDKGANNQIQGQMDFAGGTNPDGTSTLLGRWTISLHNDTTGASVGGLITSFPDTTSLRDTNLFSGVTPGSYDLSLNFAKRQVDSVSSTDPVLETCTAHFFVVAK